MKYEITKGSEKDFDGTPSWALYVETYRGNVFASEGYSAGDRYIALTGLDKGKEFIVDDETNPPGRIIAERQPITEPVVNQQLTAEWDGEGLPPVGVECELFDSEDGWQKCFIKFIGTNTAVVGTDNAEFSFELSTCEFRPTRSPEDVARDEEIEAMRDVGYALPAAIRFTKEEMAALYDAGYRKME